MRVQLNYRIALIVGALFVLCQGCNLEDLIYDADSDVEQPDVDDAIDSDTDSVDSETEPQDTDTDTVEESNDTGSDSTTPEDTDEPSDNAEGVCTETGGNWHADACGNYACGVPPECAGAEPTGGCNCGNFSSFSTTFGCSMDVVCIDLEACESDKATIDSSVCGGSVAPMGAAYNHDTERCEMLFTCAEAIPEGFHRFGSVSECEALCDGCKSNDECPEDQYCKFPAGSDCGALMDGVCTLRAEVCTAIYDPVCSCEYHIAASVCTASRLGYSIRSVGACDPQDICTHNDGTWNPGTGECECPSHLYYNSHRGCVVEPQE